LSPFFDELWGLYAFFAKMKAYLIWGPVFGMDVTGRGGYFRIHSENFL
jgi:hypothetical protein